MARNRTESDDEMHLRWFLEEEREKRIFIMNFLRMNVELWDSMSDKSTRKMLLLLAVCQPVTRILAELPTRGKDSSTEEVEWESTLLVWELSTIYWWALRLAARK